MKLGRSSAIRPYFLPGILATLGLTVGAFGWIISRSTQTKEVTEKMPIDYRSLFGFAAVIVLFIALCETFGYVISAGLMAFSMLLMLRVRLPVAVTVTLVSIPILYQVFAGVLGVPLPWGWLNNFCLFH